MLSQSTQGPFEGEIPNMETLHDIMRYVPYNRRTLTATRCVSRPYRSAVQSPHSPWASHKEMMVSRYGQCLLFNAQEDESGKSAFTLYSISSIGRKFRTASAKLLGRYNTLVANGLTRLALHHAQVESEFFAPLAALTNLRELELISCRSLTSISDASLVQSLESLTVVFCPLEPDGVAGLQLPRLKKLSLRSCTKLSNIDAVHADTAQSLEEVHIVSCAVYDDTSEAFFANLGPNLMILDLTSTFVDTALKEIPVEALASLKELLLYSTPVHSETLDSMKEPLSHHLEYLSLDNCLELQDLGMLGSLKALRFLDICRVEALQKVEMVAQCSELEMFRCAQTDLSSIAFLQDLKRLRILDAANTSLTDYTLLTLQDAPELDTVVLTGCVHISSINAFHRCPKIRRILCGRTMIANDGLNMLAECAALEELDVKMTNVTDVNCLAACPSLKVINVCGSIIAQDGVQQLLDNPQLDVICDSFEDGDYLD